MATKIKKYGFTLVELLAVIVILGIIAALIVPEVTKIIERSKRETFESNTRGIIRSANYEFKRLQLSGEPEFETIFTFVDGVESSNLLGAKLEYQGKEIQNGIVKINQDGQVALALYNDDWCATKKFNSNDIIITEFTNEENCEIQKPIDISGANAPELVSGMTPVIWDGSNWVVASNVDDPYQQNWYDYKNKKWANAKTADGSFWVWIPRYAYSITSGYHTSTAGTIDVKFLIGKTNKTTDGTLVSLVSTYSGNSQTNYVKHPAFEFDGETTGFWVAKFEPSGTSANINILPNVASLRSMTIGAQFDAALNMRNNNKYGWASSEVETYMMKNSEWGAVAYLSKSTYGANDEIWINNSSTYITGCAGNSASEANFAGCQNTYNTTTGQKASTTHNIYGIYDISGGAYESVSAYINNGNSNLTTHGANILNAAGKYKNIYAKGTTDTSTDNYTINFNVLGDAVYETSTNGGSGSTSWYGDSSYMPSGPTPWFYRGGGYSSSSATGAFNFNSMIGNASSNHSFRPVVRPSR